MAKSHNAPMQLFKYNRILLNMLYILSELQKSGGL